MFVVLEHFISLRAESIVNAVGEDQKGCGCWVTTRRVGSRCLNTTLKKRNDEIGIIG